MRPRAEMETKTRGGGAVSCCAQLRPAPPELEWAGTGGWHAVSGQAQAWRADGRPTSCGSSTAPQEAAWLLVECCGSQRLLQKPWVPTAGDIASWATSKNNKRTEIRRGYGKEFRGEEQPVNERIDMLLYK